MDKKKPTRRRNTLHDIFAAARDERLSHEEVRVWLLFRYHDFKDKGTFVGAETLGLEAGMSSRTVERHRSSLVRKGFLAQKLRGPRPALYKAIIPPEDYADVAKQADESLRTSIRTSDGKPTQICHPNTGCGDTVESFGSSNELPAERLSGVQPREDFRSAIERKDSKALLKLVGHDLYGFGEMAAQWVVCLPDTLLEQLESEGRQAAADAVGAWGTEAEVVADALRDMIRKGFAGRWNRDVFLRFVASAAEVRTGEYAT